MSNGKGGFPGGGGKMPDLGALMKQAQKLQADVQKAQEELAQMQVDGAAGGGRGTVTVNGQHDVVKIKIDKAVVDPSAIGMLEALLTRAVTAANTQMREVSNEGMA